MGNLLGNAFTRIMENLGYVYVCRSFNTDNNSVSGIIILGNTGAGKSLLANLLLDNDTFIHECHPSSVTHVTQSMGFRVGQRSHIVFNIPGLIENNQKALDQNKVEIQKAFDQCPNSIIAPVFYGGSGGRIRDEDVVTFNALNAAYHFQSESLIFIVNDLPENRPDQYEGRTTLLLEKLSQFSNIRICFLDHIDIRNPKQRRTLRSKMLRHINLAVPHVHKKHADVILLVDRIKKLEDEIRIKQDDFEKKLIMLTNQVKERQRQYEEQVKKYENARWCNIF